MALTRSLHFLILLGMGVNGALYLSWLLTPPNPDRVGYWFLIYFVVFPILGVLGLITIFRHPTSSPFWWVGGLLLLYVGILAFLMNTSQMGLGWIMAVFPQGSFELLHFGLFALTLIGLLALMFKR